MTFGVVTVCLPALQERFTPLCHSAINSLVYTRSHIMFFASIMVVAVISSASIICPRALKTTYLNIGVPSLVISSERIML